MLARAAGHEQTLSIVASATENFWQLQRLAELVRNPAGYGFESFTSGAPRLATVYRNWKKALAGEEDLRSTKATMQLWRTTLSGWEPGIWRASDVDVPVADRSFGARLRTSARPSPEADRTGSRSVAPVGGSPSALSRVPSPPGRDPLVQVAARERA